MNWSLANETTPSYSVDNNMKSFIFSLTGKTKHRLINAQNAIYNSPLLGPTFGVGRDLQIGQKGIDQKMMNEAVW